MRLRRREGWYLYREAFDGWCLWCGVTPTGRAAGSKFCCDDHRNAWTTDVTGIKFGKGIPHLASHEKRTMQ